MANLPLEHIRVLDLTRIRAGPTAVRQLADWGAAVVKIERPGETGGTMGGARLAPDFQNLHRNKRSVALDLKTDAGRELFSSSVGARQQGRRKLSPGREASTGHRLGSVRVGSELGLVVARGAQSVRPSDRTRLARRWPGELALDPRQLPQSPRRRTPVRALAAAKDSRCGRTRAAVGDPDRRSSSFRPSCVASPTHSAASRAPGAPTARRAPRPQGCSPQPRQLKSGIPYTCGRQMRLAPNHSRHIRFSHATLAVRHDQHIRR